MEQVAADHDLPRISRNTADHGLTADFAEDADRCLVMRSARRPLLFQSGRRCEVRDFQKYKRGR
jgi:hypothetical protein